MMILKKLIAATIAGVMFAAPAMASMNDESLYLDVVLNYASNLYINENVNSEYLLEEAVNAALKDNPELMYSMIKSAFSSLDEYSEFYTAEEYALQFQRLNNIFYGMGVFIQSRDGQIVIVQVQDGGGAKAAGILEGDIILAVDGISVLGYSINEVSNMVSGEEGSIVNVTVLRDGAEIEFSVVRSRVDESTVNYAVLKDNVGYLNITNFSDITPKEVEEALGVFAEYEITDIILDLRNNPGGILESVIGVANMIVPEGAIMHAIYRDETRNVTYSSTKTDCKYKFVVLANENTASAAEVLTGALQDSGIGYVIGETTYGKGLIQEIFVLPGGDAFKITTGHYLTRNGNDIQSTGIYPNEVVKNHKEQIDLEQYESFDYATKWKLGDSGKGVLAAKQRLAVLGYYDGTIDENFDYMLEHAVYKFQEDTDLYPYGVLDFSTQATLENKFYVIEVVVDDQFDAAYQYFIGDNQVE